MTAPMLPKAESFGATQRRAIKRPSVISITPSTAAKLRTLITP